eukprot:6488369-Amphidinium_carterae.1
MAAMVASVLMRQLEVDSELQGDINAVQETFGVDQSSTSLASAETKFHALLKSTSQCQHCTHQQPWHIKLLRSSSVKTLSIPFLSSESFPDA